MDLEKIGEVLAAALGGGIITAGGALLLSYLKQRHELRGRDREAERQERKDALQEMQDIVTKMREDLDRADGKAERALENERECEKKWVRAVSYIEYIGYEARRQGWPIRPWSEHGSAEHPALPTGQIPPGDSGPNWGMERRREDSPGKAPGGRDRRGGARGPGRGRQGGPVEPYGPNQTGDPDQPAGPGN